MSDVQIDQEFFSAARRGLKTLSAEQQEVLKTAVENEILANGAFGNADGEEDLYITSFGIQLATLLGIDNKVTADYLHLKKDGVGLDFLHVVSLARCWRFFSHDSLEIGFYGKIAEKIEYNRRLDGAWNQAAGTHFSSVYGTFLAISAYQNLDQTVPEEVKILNALKGLKSNDGAFGVDQGAEDGTTPSTAFAAIILNYMEESSDYCVSWLLKQQFSDGGFRAVSRMPFSDVQSTVYAMMALYLAAPEKFKAVSADAKRFITSQQKESGFSGHCKDESTTLENTFLALCGLGLVD